MLVWKLDCFACGCTVPPLMDLRFLAFLENVRGLGVNVSHSETSLRSSVYRKGPAHSWSWYGWWIGGGNTKRKAKEMNWKCLGPLAGVKQLSMVTRDGSNPYHEVLKKVSCSGRKDGCKGYHYFQLQPRRSLSMHWRLALAGSFKVHGNFQQSFVLLISNYFLFLSVPPYTNVLPLHEICSLVFLAVLILFSWWNFVNI